MGAGKSTQANLLAEALDVPRIPMDRVRFDYYREIGYDDEYTQRLREEGGMRLLMPYWKPFEAHAVERVVADHRGAVIDFGAGHSVFEDEVLFERVREALLPVRNVVLLLPSPDRDKSMRVLITGVEASAATLPEAQREGLVEMQRLFVEHRSNYVLAKRTVYTHGDMPEETRDKILAVLS
jgi:hypothetical protein